MNPERKARKNIFLSESNKKAERQALKTVLKLWAESLKTTDDLLELVNESTKKSEQAKKALKKNLAVAVEESKELEENYRHGINLISAPSLNTPIKTRKIPARIVAIISPSIP
mgnify:CR=1 FL=1